MSVRRMNRVNELLKREIGQQLYRIVDECDIDMSAVTITRVVTSGDLRNAQVFVSVRDGDKSPKAVVSRLRRYRVELQSLISRNIVLRFTPRLSFTLDTSLQEGDRVLGILRDLEVEPVQEEEQHDSEEGT